MCKVNPSTPRCAHCSGRAIYFRVLDSLYKRTHKVDLKEEKIMGKIIGIDLGTTFSVVAVMEAAEDYFGMGVHTPSKQP